MAQFLELAQLFNGHRMTEVNVWRSRVHTQFHTQGAPQLEAFLQLFTADHDGGAAHQHV